MNDIHKYDSIINLTYQKSKNRPHMSKSDRAAQFGAFSALTGYKEAIIETGQLVDKWHEPDENTAKILNDKTKILLDNIDFQPTVKITYFDEISSSYIAYTGKLRHIDKTNKFFIMLDNTKINMKYIIKIESDAFSNQFDE